ncbi:MAG: glutathione synthase [Alphaproteobacteria bacterium]|nr:glutathione synthase [Alphaproteobacteria bacterium]
MSFTVALQMDPPQSINIDKDSTFVIGLEAQKRGHDLFYYSPDSLTLRDGMVYADCATLEFRRKRGNHCTLGAFERRALSDFDLILMRQDFNNPRRYTALAHMLDHLKGKTLVLNDPEGVRESPEKLLITHFPDLAPPTLITRNLQDIYDFHAEHNEIIIKPMNGFGGLDIYHMREGDTNLPAVYDMLCRLHSEPFIVQRYIPEIRQGDKRIIVVEGEPIGALLRVPADGNARANLQAGGKAAPGQITARDREICARLKTTLIERGLVLVGLDVIGDYVTEINPKSPTGLQQIYKLQGIKCEKALWDAYEARLAAFKKKVRAA